MYLTAAELPTYYPEASSMPQPQVTKYLNRANAYAQGVIGGLPPTVDDGLRTAVALAFEILAESGDGQTDPVNGNVTEVSGAGMFARKEPDALERVKIMLLPYKNAFDASNSQKAERGVRFL